MEALQIFVSHSHKDNVWCDKFVEGLNEYNVDIWYDKQGLKAGARWVKTIEQELESRDIFIVVITPNSWQSEWVQDELSIALSQHKRIIGIMIEDTKVGGFLATRQILSLIGRDVSNAVTLIVSELGLTLRKSVDRISTEPPNPSTLTNAINIAGTWKGKDNRNRNWELVLTQNGHNVIGEGQYKTGFGLSFYIITGSIEENKIKMTLKETKNPIINSFDFEFELIAISPTQLAGNIISMASGMFAPRSGQCVFFNS